MSHYGIRSLGHRVREGVQASLIGAAVDDVQICNAVMSRTYVGVHLYVTKRGGTKVFKLHNFG